VRHAIKAPDSLSEAGAQALADRLQRYWAHRGLQVRTRISVEKISKKLLYGVRSDIVGGKPVTDVKTTGE
jgi:hypothetical protein